MNDTDVDRLLTGTGAQWRAEHHDSAAVDWTAVTPRHDRRVWFAVAAAAAVVALVVAVPVAMSGRPDRRNYAPGRGPTPTPSSAAHAMAGAPKWFFALAGGRLRELDAHTANQIGAFTVIRHPARVAGAAADARNGYFATAVPGCRVRIERVKVVGDHGGIFDVATIAGRLGTDGGQYAGIAVSPDNAKLALSVMRCSNANSEDLVVVDTNSGAVRRWHGQRTDVSYVGSLQWSPDGSRLAFTWTPCCGGSTDGTHLLYVDEHRSTSYLETPRLLPQYSASSGRPFGPVFWWHGQLAVFDNGVVRSVLIRDVDAAGNIGLLDKVLATGFPRNVLRVSADPTGEHLLVTTDNGTNPAQVFRYDRGVLTEIPGRWFQPAW